MTRLSAVTSVYSEDGRIMLQAGSVQVEINRCGPTARANA
jgi:hypothetical protein